jgi:hypothetical protein
MKPSANLLLLLALVAAGCQAKAPTATTRYEFIEQLRQQATRDDSRVNPKAMLQSELLNIVREPNSREPIDDASQRWHYEFVDGPLDLIVLVEPGSDWQQPDPTVFVDFKRLPQE